MKMTGAMTKVLLFTLLISRGAVMVNAQDTELTRATLKGLKGLYVVIEDLRPEVEQAGLTKSAIQTDVELKLRQAGISVLSREQWLNEPGWPYLYVNVNVNPRSDYSWPYNILLELKQRVILSRDPTIDLNTTTWSVHAVGAYFKANIRDLRNDIKDNVDLFINTYVSVNPK